MEPSQQSITPANRREALHEILCTLLGSRYVYFQAPETVKMNYPAIRYERSDIDEVSADNTKYLLTRQYRLTYISLDPDSDVMIDKILTSFPMSTYVGHAVVDNINHDTFEIYY